MMRGWLSCFSLLWFMLLAQAVAAADVGALRSRWQNLVGMEASLLAPKRFEDARRAMDALESAVNQGDARLIESRAGTASERLDVLAEKVDLARSLWQAALEARAQARQANAPALAPKTYDEAENVLMAAARKLEVGRDEAAKRQAQGLAPLFEAARLQATRVKLVGSAKSQLEEAERAEAMRYAPRSYVRAMDAVTRVEQLLLANPADDERVQTASARAARETQHAVYLLDHLKGTCADVSRTRLESEIVDWEDGFRIVAHTLGVEPDFSAGMRKPIQEVQVVADQLLRERNALRTQLAFRNAQVDSLLGLVQGLRRDVRSAQGEVAALRPFELEARVVEQVQQRFSLSEGRVLVDNRDLILRLHGLRFASGESEVGAANYLLLDKVVETLRDLPEAYVIIEGHTDSKGRESSNMELSQLRAESVRAYLVQKAGLDPSRVTTVGYGSTRPVATNDTEEGRALNRRIEIIISRPG